MLDRVARARHLHRQLELDSGREVAELERRLAEAELDLEEAGVVLAQRTRLATDGLISEGELLAAQVQRKKAELVPYDRGDLVNRLHEQGEVLSVEHVAEGTLVSARVHEGLASELEQFAVREG